MKRRPRAAVRRRVLIDSAPPRRALRAGNFRIFGCGLPKTEDPRSIMRPPPVLLAQNRTTTPKSCKIMQSCSFFTPVPRRRPLPHRYPIPAPASPCRARAFPRRNRPNSAAALPNRYPETPPRLARQGKSIFLRGYDIHQIARFQAFFGKNRYQISKFCNL